MVHHDDMEFLMLGGWCFREMNGISSMSLVAMTLSKGDTDWCVAKYHFPYPFRPGRKLAMGVEYYPETYPFLSG